MPILPDFPLPKQNKTGIRTAKLKLTKCSSLYTCFRTFYRCMIQYRRCVASFVVDSGGPAAAAAAYREEGEGERGAWPCLASGDFLWRRKLSSPAAQAAAAVWMNA